MTPHLRAAVTGAIGILITSAVFAQPPAGQPLPAPAGDPPGRVARVSFVGGTVSFRAADADAWNTATLNFPVTIGDHVWTDAGGRAELELGTATARVAPMTDVSILNLDDRTAQFRVTQGTLSLRVRNLNQGDIVEVDTPTGAITLAQPGLYRVDVSDTGDSSTVTVRRGEADVNTTQVLALRDNQSAIVAANGEPPAVNAAIRIDDFEDWVLTRDRREETAVQTAQYVPPGMPGAADLVQYGAWTPTPEYGTVWVPRVAPGWVPYRDGQWAYVQPWGWTWVDAAPWGYAPFHYGRWVMTPAGWAWVPGRVDVRPVYAPALVAFVGGNNWSASLSIGQPVAWFPLGPREVFVPAYTVSPVYVRAINGPHVVVTNVTVINPTTVVYVNRTVPGAVTAVPQAVFVSARPVGPVAVAVPRETIRGAVVVGTSVPLQPTRVVVAARVAAPPVAVVERRVIVKQQPAPAARARIRPRERAASRRARRAANAGCAGSSVRPRRLQHPAAPRPSPRN